MNKEFSSETLRECENSVLLRVARAGILAGERQQAETPVVQSALEDNITARE